MNNGTQTKNIKEKESIDFSNEWLCVKDYELKILILTSILAENNFAYRGTLKLMCEWLGVKSSSNNNNNIKAAIFSLSDKGYLFYKQDGRVWTLSISQKGMKDKQIVKIRKSWVKAFKNYNRDESNNKIDKSISIDWTKILKVFIYLYNRTTHQLTTLDDISLDLNMSRTTIDNTIKAIQSCDLCGIRFYRDIVKDKFEKDGETFYFNKGSDFGFIVMFDE